MKKNLLIGSLVAAFLASNASMTFAVSPEEQIRKLEIRANDALVTCGTERKNALKTIASEALVLIQGNVVSEDRAKFLLEFIEKQMVKSC